MDNDSLRKARLVVEKQMARDPMRRDSQIGEYLAIFDAVSPELRYLFAGSDAEIADLVSMSRSNETAEIPELDQLWKADPLSETDRSTFDSQVLLEKMGLGSLDSSPAPTNWQMVYGTLSYPAPSNEQIAKSIFEIAKMAEEDRAFRELLEKKEKTKFTSATAGTFMQRLVDHAEELVPDATITAFLRSYIVGDKEGARSAVRQMISTKA
jgi:hypothetical protein